MSIKTIAVMNGGITRDRTIVRPNEAKEVVTDAGIIIPEDASTYSCQEGVVVTSSGNKIKSGDTIVYRKRDRSLEEFDKLEWEGKLCDVVYDDEIFIINETPNNRIFVQPVDAEVKTSLFISKEANYLPQNGVIVKAPANSILKPGDKVKYRKAEGSIYDTADVDGVLCDVMYEKDLFTINDKAAPYIIILEIDLVAQKKRREQTESGIFLSPLHIFMLRNLQQGKVVSVGEKAQEAYPELSINDTAILHHRIESEAYRLLSEHRELGQPATKEYRIINTYSGSTRDIFGKIERSRIFKSHGGLMEDKVIPFSNNVFLEWDFKLLEKKVESDMLLTELDIDIYKCTDIESLKSEVKKLTETYVKKYKFQLSKYIMNIQRLNPENNIQRDRADEIERAIELLKKNAMASAKATKKDHLLIATVSQINSITQNELEINRGDKVITGYKTLYPITIGKKSYLIAEAKLLIGKM